MKLPKTLEEIHPPLADATDVINKINTRTHVLRASVALRTERLHTNSPEQGNVELNNARAIAGLTQLPEILPDHEQIVKDRAELNKLAASMNIARANVDRQKALASTKLCEAIAPEHTALVKDMAAKLAALHASHTAYVKFLDALQNTGSANTYLRPVWPTTIGSPFDTSGSYHWTFKEMRENGHITRRSTPMELILVLVGVLAIAVVGAICFIANDKFASDR
jgi:hypothetical protein